LAIALTCTRSYIHAKLLDYEPFIEEAELPTTSRGPSTVYRRIVTGDELAAQDHAAASLVESPLATDGEEAAAMLDDGTVTNG